MRTPEALETLVEYGLVEEVLRPLMSGKEAQIYLVRSGGELRVAKIYKDAQVRSFKQRSEYTEGRTTRNTRDRRAMAKHSRHGKKEDEAAWRSAEVNAIYRLSEAGVRVPVPHHFVDGVLIMELVCDHEGQPAPRLGDLDYPPEVAQQIFDWLLAAVVRMLCAGIVHGDLSEFNVLMAADGPVVIDFPQAVDPATNQSARRLLIRDVDNLLRFHSRYVRGARPLPYAQEMWELYQQNLLTPETRLQGRITASRRPVNTTEVLALIDDAKREHQRRVNPSAPQGPRGPQGPKVEILVRQPRGATTSSPQRPAQGNPTRHEGPTRPQADSAPRRAPEPSQRGVSPDSASRRLSPDSAPRQAPDAASRRATIEPAQRDVRQDAAPRRAPDSAPRGLSRDADSRRATIEPAQRDVRQEAAPRRLSRDAAPRGVSPDGAPRRASTDAPRRAPPEPAQHDVRQDAAPRRAPESAPRGVPPESAPREAGSEPAPARRRRRRRSRGTPVGERPTTGS